MHRVWIGLGGLLGLGAVGMAAAAAHALGGLTPAALRGVDSGVQMQGWHALALLGCGVWAERRTGWPRRLANAAGAAFVLGTLLFCGAVYASGLAGIALAAVAPAGGLLLMLGWLLLAASALMTKQLQTAPPSPVLDGRGAGVRAETAISGQAGDSPAPSLRPSPAGGRGRSGAALVEIAWRRPRG